MEDRLYSYMIKSLYLNRKDDGIKSDFGKTLIIGGSQAYPGAPLIAAKLCRYSGCGYVSLAVPETIFPLVFSKIPETIVHQHIQTRGDNFFFNTGDEKVYNSYSAILFGNGIAPTVENRSFLTDLLCSYEGILVLDATGIDFLAQNPNLIKRKNEKLRIILTPHLGEAARLFHVDNLGRDPKDYVSYAMKYVRENNVFFLLKSSRSLFIGHDEVVEADQIPTAALGKAGSGDGLAGYLTGILSYAMKFVTVKEAVLFADRIIHEAARRTAKKRSAGLTDILEIQDAIREIVLEHANDND